MEEHGLLADIREHPDDAALRRIYADWLDDHGDSARAEFIRVQLDLAALGEWDDARPALEKRQAQLLREHEQQWLTGLPRKGLEYRLAGGFAEEVAGPAHRVLTHLGRTERTFLPRRLRLKQHRPTERVFWETTCAATRRIARLQLNWEAQPDSLARLLDRNHWESLREMQLRAGNRFRQTIDPIANSACASSLRELTITGGEAHADALVPLAAWPWAGGLRSFEMEANPFSPEAVARLARSPACATLTALNLGIIDLSVALEMLREAAFTPSLERLVLWGPSSDTENLWERLHFGQLRHLNVQTEDWEPIELNQMADAPWFTQLESLSFQGFHVDASLLVRPNAPKLTRLSTFLHNEKAQMERLINWSIWESLRCLDLSSGAFTGESLAWFLSAVSLTELRECNLSSNPIGDQGVIVLAGWPGLSHLWRLNLGSTEITDAGARALLDALPPLVELNLRCNRLSADAVAAFHALEASGHIGTLKISDPV